MLLGENTPASFMRLVGVYGAIFVLFSTTFITLFHTPLFTEQGVLFYRGIFLLLIATCCLGILLGLFRKYWSKVSLETIFAAVVASAAINLTIFVVFPVTFDRSVTMYILATLDKAPPKTLQCNGYSTDELEKIFIDNYVHRQGAITRRIREQSIIQFVSVNDACVAITETGRKFLTSSELIGKLYGLSPSL